MVRKILRKGSKVMYGNRLAIVTDFYSQTPEIHKAKGRRYQVRITSGSEKGRRVWLSRNKISSRKEGRK